MKKIKEYYFVFVFLNKKVLMSVMRQKNKKIDQVNLVREKNNLTRRVTVKKLENILYKSFKILDKGFVRVIDYMGDDSSIVQAARVSYGKGTKKLNEDKNLINYLLSHRHSTPFEMNEIKFHVKLPIFVARQWIRHRTANVNEYSARYSILESEFYLPHQKNIQAQAKSNNQGREDLLNDRETKEYLELIKKNSRLGFKDYRQLLNENDDGKIINQNKTGVARELARMVLPLNTYTEWYWKIDLHNLMHFLSLRFDHHAQYEIRVYAEKMLEILKKWVPVTYEAFVTHRLENISLSKNGVDYIKNLIHGNKNKKIKISKREEKELKSKFDLI